MGEVLAQMTLEDVLTELNINTDGGPYVEGNASIGGDFVGRDKVVNVFIIGLSQEKKISRHHLE